MRFTWDNIKNAQNIKDHDIDFMDAATIFDQDLLIEFDINHSDFQDRWTAYGLLGGAVIRVTFTMRENDEVCHLISAREAVKNEEERYYRNRF